MRRYGKHANISVLFLILNINPSGNFESDLNASGRFIKIDECTFIKTEGIRGE